MECRQGDYRMTANVGDVVEMPNGMLGTINDSQIICGGHIREIHVRPHTNLFYCLLRELVGANHFCEQEINTLKLITPATTPI